MSSIDDEFSANLAKMTRNNTPEHKKNEFDKAAESLEKVESLLDETIEELSLWSNPFFVGFAIFFLGLVSLFIHWVFSLL